MLGSGLQSRGVCGTEGPVQPGLCEGLLAEEHWQPRGSIRLHGASGQKKGLLAFILRLGRDSVDRKVVSSVIWYDVHSIKSTSACRFDLQSAQGPYKLDMGNVLYAPVAFYDQRVSAQHCRHEQHAVCPSGLL